LNTVSPEASLTICPVPYPNSTTPLVFSQQNTQSEEIARNFSFFVEERSGPATRIEDETPHAEERACLKSNSSSFSCSTKEVCSPWLQFLKTC
jgi:hypothetical protein